MTIDDARKTVTIDEAELVLRIFGYLTRRDPEQLPKAPARQTLASIERVIEETNDDHQGMALAMSTDLAKIALAWITGEMNAQAMAAGEGEVAKKISRAQARQ